MLVFSIILLAIGLSIVLRYGKAKYDDIFFFKRKREFKKLLSKNELNSSLELLDMLIKTKEKHWEIGRESMVYRPYPNVAIWFNHMNLLKVTIFVGTGIKKVFQLEYSSETNKVKNGYDFVTKQSLKPEEEFRAKHILLHLDKILTTLLSQDYKNQLKNEKSFSEMKDELKHQLLSIMEIDMALDGGYRRYGFLLQLKREKNYQTLLVSFEDVLYFQALQMERLGDISTTVHNKDHFHAQLFTELEKELIWYVKKVFDENPLGELSMAEKHLATFEDFHKNTLRNIHRLMMKLENEEEWLSVESLHQLNETLPNDLKTLSEVYRAVNDKEEVRYDVEQTLQTIVEKLEDFYLEAEQNKKLAIKKSKMVIERR